MNDVELFQQFCLKHVNRKVKEYFKDIDDIPFTDEIDTNNTRLVCRTVCTHKDIDPISLTVGRLVAFSLIVRDPTEEIPIYGIPVQSFQETKEYYPQVTLMFREKTASANARNTYPTRAEVSFRILDNNFTEANARSLAVKIKNIFATPPVSFKKGRTKVSYSDQKKGYHFIMAVNSETEAREIITKVLSLNNDTPDWEKLSNSESGYNFSATKTKTILSKTVIMPKRRPIADVYFTHAELKIYGLSRPKILVDTLGRFRDAYEYV